MCIKLVGSDILPSLPHVVFIDLRNMKRYAWDNDINSSIQHITHA